MVVPKRFSVNTLFHFDSNTQINPQESSKGISMEMKITTSRGQLALLSSNSSREALVYSDAFFTECTEYIHVRVTKFGPEILLILFLFLFIFYFWI